MEQVASQIQTIRKRNPITIITIKKICKLLQDGRDLLEYPKLQQIATISVLEQATIIVGHYGLAKVLVNAVMEYMQRKFVKKKIMYQCPKIKVRSFLLTQNKNSSH